MRIGAIPILKQLQRRIRHKRIQNFLNRVQPQKDWSILDVGGTHPIWQCPELKSFSAVLLNLGAYAIPEKEAHRLTSVAGDATALTYSDDQFDLIFSNSVIEHVGTYENQKKFANEAKRCGKRLWIQTPAREFFFEPHYITPFIHWFPKTTRAKLVRYFTIWGLFAKPDKEAIQERIDEIRLLTKEEMHELFPDCEIIEEKFLGMTKSYIALS